MLRQVALGIGTAVLVAALTAPVVAQQRQTPFSASQDLRADPPSPDERPDKDRPPGSSAPPREPSRPTVRPDPTERLPDRPNREAVDFAPAGTGGRAAPPVSSPGAVTPSAIPTPPAPLAGEAQDPTGIVPGEVLAVSASLPEAVTLAQDLAPRGYSVLRRRAFNGLGGLAITAFRVPQGRSVADALNELRQDFPQLWVAPNDLFDPAAGQGAPRLFARDLIGWPATAGSCGAGTKVGIIDTGVDAAHPALKGRSITLHSLLPAGLPLAEAHHGTAVAALLVGDPAQGHVAGLLPEAELFSVAVFHKTDDRPAVASAERVAAAVDWLAQQGVRLINLSLAGRENLVLRLVLDRAQEAGLVMAAAVGNAGPDAKVAFPATHPGVVAVTAVDAAGEVFAQANRGPEVDFAAPGVDVWSATAGGHGSYHSGTSFAVPFVLAAIALSQSSSAQPVAALRGRVQDLGTEGRDSAYGWGLIHAAGLCPADLASE